MSRPDPVSPSYTSVGEPLRYCGGVVEMGAVPWIDPARLIPFLPMFGKMRGKFCRYASFGKYRKHFRNTSGPNIEKPNGYFFLDRYVVFPDILRYAVNVVIYRGNDVDQSAQSSAILYSGRAGDPYDALF
jgi:hypothetical protein